MQISGQAAILSQTSAIDHDDDEEQEVSWVRNLDDCFSPSASFAEQETCWEDEEVSGPADECQPIRDWSLPLCSRVSLDRSFTGFYVNGKICHNYGDAQRALRPVGK